MNANFKLWFLQVFHRFPMRQGVADFAARAAAEGYDGVICGAETGVISILRTIRPDRPATRLRA